VIDCGVGEDTALVDAIDTVSGCEIVNGGGAGGGGRGGTGGRGGGGAPGAPAGLAFTVKGLTLSVPCAAACKVSAVVTADKATARKLRLGSTRIGTGASRLKAAGTAKVKLKLTRKAKRVRKAMVKVTVTTAAGRQTATKALKLGR
jgi:hypothetical protein